MSVRIKLAQLLAGKNNLIVPLVATDRMRITFLANMSNGTEFNRSYRAMMMMSPNYKEGLDESDKQ